MFNTPTTNNSLLVYYYKLGQVLIAVSPIVDQRRECCVVSPLVRAAVDSEGLVMACSSGGHWRLTAGNTGRATSDQSQGFSEWTVSDPHTQPRKRMKNDKSDQAMHGQH